MTPEFIKKIKKIRAFIFDVDGVMTDGSLLLLEDGEMLRKMNIKDGYAIRTALKNLYKLGVISGSGSEAIQKRLENLGVTDFVFYTYHKKEVLEKFILEYGIDSSEVLYMGDDILDIAPMKVAGIAACPHDAVDEVIEISDYVCIKKGGEGCVREIIELVLKLQNSWPKNG